MVCSSRLREEPKEAALLLFRTPTPRAASVVFASRRPASRVNIICRNPAMCRYTFEAEKKVASKRERSESERRREAGFDPSLGEENLK